MYGCRKLRRRPNGKGEIALMGLLNLAFLTVAGGYGFKDGAPDPVFFYAFSVYFGPAMTAIVIELVRLKEPPVSN